MVDFQNSKTKNTVRQSCESLLVIEDVCTFYGDAQALKDICLTVKNNEIVAVLGSNGAGKTTLLKTLTGLLGIQRGKIVFNNETITDTPSHKIIRKGIACVPEGRQLFGAMTVSDTLLLGTYSLDKDERKKMQGARLEMIFDLFPVLRDRVNQASETLSGGEQQMLALGRALMSNPKFLVLDEPSLGLSPLLVKEMMNMLKLISRELGISILLVEQNARAAIKIADYIYILERGEVTLANTAQKVMASEKIQSAYLGA
ncbi:MAG: ABC transporter ATP-binding protein [Desulfobacula sp.]|uniref:ABC transporter ATP-binding protein n=1 Tax=Desulfobacula sp. TaxID=2593537 RepID=UPI0025C421CD|nr:ABC transporter ATP-binding protein [Desulfobacula sp.]MCD4721682.1 ABC transporter ATP-binding protein [Desulfobacula sp.]